ncbi:MAG: hypothetical protein GY868_20880, partial [Deltaproteobacteria bacterium]|nr:hypothetical protein [Deltaproteobacteria bacterium]
MKKLTIRHKLTLILMLTSTVAVLLVGTTTVVLSYLANRQAIIRDLTGLADVVAHNCNVSLAFNIPEDAEKILTAL